MWSYGIHRGLGLPAKYISQDLENQVMIITGTEDQWLSTPDYKYLELLDDNSEKGAIQKNFLLAAGDACGSVPLRS